MAIWKSTHTERRNRTASTRVLEYAHPGGHKTRTKSAATVRYWTETAHVELTIDIEAVIKQLAAKAIKSKAGKSALAGGAIKIKITKRVETDVRVEELPLGKGYTEVAAGSAT